MDLGQLERMQDQWMEEMAPSQQREERLITNKMDSNNKMIFHDTSSCLCAGSGILSAIGK